MNENAKVQQKIKPTNPPPDLVDCAGPLLEFTHEEIALLIYNMNLNGLQCTYRTPAAARYEAEGFAKIDIEHTGLSAWAFMMHKPEEESAEEGFWMPDYTDETILNMEHVLKMLSSCGILDKVEFDLEEKEAAND